MLPALMIDYASDGSSRDWEIVSYALVRFTIGGSLPNLPNVVIDELGPMVAMAVIRSPMRYFVV